MITVPLWISYLTLEHVNIAILPLSGLPGRIASFLTSRTLPHNIVLCRLGGFDTFRFVLVLAMKTPVSLLTGESVFLASHSPPSAAEGARRC